jgi:hypothetical protein
MDQSRWYRDTTLLALGMSVDHMLRADSSLGRMATASGFSGKVASNSALAKKDKAHRSKPAARVTVRYRRLA